MLCLSWTLILNVWTWIQTWSGSTVLHHGYYLCISVSYNRNLDHKVPKANGMLGFNIISVSCFNVLFTFLLFVCSLTIYKCGKQFLYLNSNVLTWFNSAYCIVSTVVVSCRWNYMQLYRFSWKPLVIMYLSNADTEIHNKLMDSIVCHMSQWQKKSR